MDFGVDSEMVDFEWISKMDFEWIRNGRFRLDFEVVDFGLDFDMYFERIWGW